MSKNKIKPIRWVMFNQQRNSVAIRFRADDVMGIEPLSDMGKWSKGPTRVHFSGACRFVDVVQSADTVLKEVDEAADSWWESSR